MTTQNRYQTVKELGRNPEGGRVTSLGLDISVNPPVKVVLKEFRFAQQDSNWSGFKAYQQEIEVLKALNHPRIPGYRDSFETPAGFCLVQEYKEASSLDKRRTFKPEEIKQIAVSMLEILVYLQQQIPPVIHRDIKPENILIDKQKNVYLVDFGFARIGQEKNAVSSVCAGTMGFMSPEQLFNRPLSKASDVYSLGATLIALVTNTRSANIGNLVDDNSRFNLQGIAPQLNPLFMKWLKKMVEPNSKRRFPNAEAALKALQPIDIAGKSSPLTILRDLCKNLNLSPEVRSRIIVCGSGTLIIAAFFLPNSLKYPIIQLFGGKPIIKICEGVMLEKSKIVMDYLKWGGNPNATTENSDNKSLLECALIGSYPNKNIVKELIDKGADVNVMSKDMNTPLLVVSYGRPNENTLDLAKLLIAKGAQLNVENRFNATPLFGAISQSNTELAKLLIAKGARVDIKNLEGRNSLHIMAASRFADPELAEFFIAKGVGIDDNDSKFNTPLLLAMENNNSLMAKLLIAKGARVNVKNTSNVTPVQIMSNLELTKLLIAKGADINVKDLSGNTPLLKAIYLTTSRNNSEEITQLLIAKGADVNAKNYQGETPLHIAVSQSSLRTVELLVQKGADVNAKDNYFTTPLHGAVSQGSLRTVELLVQKGADVNAKDRFSTTPLHIAASQGSFQKVELLVQKGADFNAKNDRGETPLALARKNKNFPNVIKFLESLNSSQ